jgi:cytochrome P450
VLCDPEETFILLQRNDPVHWSSWLHGWVVTRYDDVRLLLGNNEALSADTVSAARDRLAPAALTARKSTFEVLADWLPFIDPPDHRRLRSLINKAFTPAAVRSMRPRIERLAHKILRDLEATPSVELIESYSHRLTLSMICELLGVDATNHRLVLLCAHQIQSLIHSALGDEHRRASAERGFNQLIPLIADIVEARRAEPREDLISAMVSSEVNGAVLSTREIIATSILLIFAGQETTTSLVALTLLALLQNPDQLTLLRGNPSLITGTVEETLRYWGVAWSVTRVARAPLELRGMTINRGEQVVLVLGSANRDPRKFKNPGQFDIRRAPNQHIAFGASIHFCLGAPLARLEDEVAVMALFEHFPNVRLDDNYTARWLPQLITRQLEGIHVRLTG